MGNNIFFGEFSVGSQSLPSLLSQMERYKSTFRAMECLNKEIPSKFLLAVDKRYQIWLKECKIYLGRNDMSNSIINFSSIVSQVFFGTFHMDLPPTFKMIALKGTIYHKGGKRPELEPGNDKWGKKKGKKGDNPWDLIKNKHPHAELCMLANETWAIIFANNNLDKCPKWGKKSGCCPCWFLNRYCFSNCKNKESHIKAKKIPAMTLAKILDQFMPPVLTGWVGV
jgi:hypothetical protein